MGAGCCRFKHGGASRRHDDGIWQSGTQIGENRGSISLVKRMQRVINQDDVWPQHVQPRKGEALALALMQGLVPVGCLAKARGKVFEADA